METNTNARQHIRFYVDAEIDLAAKPEVQQSTLAEIANKLFRSANQVEVGVFARGVEWNRSQTYLGGPR